MQKEFNDGYEIIAKHCPVCDAVVQAKIINIKNKRLSSIYKCTQCDWHHP